MPITPLMTWVKSRKGWMKEYKGRKYAVSCKQLEMPPTLEHSVLAANNWWTRKQQEIDAQDRPAPTTSVLDQVASLIGADLPPALAAQLLALRGRDGVPVVTVKSAVEDWRKALLAAVNARNIDVSRYDSYCRYVKKFTDWIGEETEVRQINDNKVEAYWAFLGTRLSERTYAAATCQQALMTAKQFIRWAAEKGLMPLPANLNNRRLRFTIETETPEVVTVEELRRLFAVEGYKRTKLYVLLFLNCGMYQSDVSDLGRKEVDFKAGTITRPRSKRKKGVVARYQLWTDTWHWLYEFQSKVDVPNERGDHRVLLTERGTQLTEFRRAGEKMQRKDNVHTAWTRLCKEAGVEGKSIKHLRKTGATMLASHPSYKYYVPYYLSHAPKSVAEKHYVVPSDDEFFEALDWLHDQIFPPAKPNQ